LSKREKGLAMASGMDHMFSAMLGKLVENLPPEVKANIDKIGSTVLAFKQQMDRIEANQLVIIRASNLPPEILSRLEIPARGISHGLKSERDAARSGDD